MVLEYSLILDDNFGSILKYIGKPKVAAGGEVGMALLPLTPLYPVHACASRGYVIGSGVHI